MKFSAMICAVGLALLPTTSHSAVPQTPAPDWVLAVASVGSNGAAGLSLRLNGRGHGNGEQPPPAGEGFSWPGHYSRAAIFGMGGGGIQLRTGGGAGAVDVSLATPVDDQFNEFVFDYSFAIEDSAVAGGDEVAILAFFPGASIDVYSTVLEVASGSGTVAVRSGSGSVAVRVADPTRPDTAAGIGPAGAALNLSRSRSVATGIVGAFNIDECEGFCQGAWQGPGVEGGYTQVHPHLVYGAGALLGNYWFAGPTGEWTLNWTGSAFADERPIGSLLANPVVFGWAPIGVDYQLFHIPSPVQLPTP